MGGRDGAEKVLFWVSPFSLMLFIPVVPHEDRIGECKNELEVSLHSMDVKLKSGISQPTPPALLSIGSQLEVNLFEPIDGAKEIHQSASAAT
jgi:hypothetical protein